ncbi:FecR family protein [Pedobacter sp. SL55]|uniref:FecR family protein n=1 Tax=Pedobacter sp. SL55 TaxID=2995161 RepID=UPI0022701773|nr:FecR family protein [Pedobacter sp. SL55]WAC40813.1 FecR family protein [Pedobacter sp. SL55]
MKRTEAEELLNKYANGNCTEEELAILHTWYLEQEKNIPQISAEEVEMAKQKVWAGLAIHEAAVSKTVKLFSTKIVKRIAAAAVVVLSLYLGYYTIQKNQLNLGDKLTKQEQILPGGNKAVLTLADGSTIDLSNVKKGLLSHSNGANIVKTADGKLVYNTDKGKTKAVAWNTLSIPAGGCYNVTLSDGTVVWLNAKSSLKYPTEFTGKERIVELDGEGYFEVAHNSKKPFKVVTQHQTVEVLGTHFNINAYQDEQSTTTTLLEGSVRINASGAQKLLIPNQQAKLSAGKMTITSYNTDNAIDWVSNDFIFDNESLSSIMRKISRWYNVEVSYPANLSNIEFTGSISRSKNITQVLKIMELTGMVNFKVEGRRITVIP